VIQNYSHLISITHFQYFWDSLERIADANYSPNDEDIVRARMRTSGSNSTAVFMDRNYFEFYDVGGQKPERAKWETVISENTFSTLLYFVACDEFDVRDDEKDFDKTKMEISRLIFNEIVNSNVVGDNIPIILFLNREDIFEQRIKTEKGFASFKDTFPEYDGPNDKVKGMEYIRSFFCAVVKENSRKAPIKCHYTCALDRDGLVVVWRTIREFLLKEALKSMNLL